MNMQSMKLLLELWGEGGGVWWSESVAVSGGTDGAKVGFFRDITEVSEWHQVDAAVAGADERAVIWGQPVFLPITHSAAPSSKSPTSTLPNAINVMPACCEQMTLGFNRVFWIKQRDFGVERVRYGEKNSVIVYLSSNANSELFVDWMNTHVTCSNQTPRLLSDRLTFSWTD